MAEAKKVGQWVKEDSSALIAYITFTAIYWHIYFKIW